MAHAVGDLIRRDKPWRSEQYLAFVRSQPCANCGDTRACEAHHLIGIAGIGTMGGKAGDQFAVPLCRQCHEDLHRAKVPLSDQWYWLKRMLERGFNEGPLGVKA